MAKNYRKQQRVENGMKVKCRMPAVSETLIQAISELPNPLSEPFMTKENFDADIVVIGAGPGGYVCAIRAAQLGAKVICVEKEHLGGVCLNWGCIPSKTMIAAAEQLEKMKKHTAEMGIEVQGEIIFNFEKTMERKNKIVSTQQGGIGGLFKKNRIDHRKGTASFIDPNTIQVDKEDGTQEIIKAKHFVLAVGSKPIYINVPGLTGGRDNNVWTSNDAVTAPFVPNKILILGGGAIGCEFSYIFNGYGSQVTLVEMMPNLIPMCDEELGIELAKSLSKKGVNIKAGTSLDSCEKTSNGWKCTISKEGQKEIIEVDVVLLGIGRQANTQDMNLEKIGIKMHKRGIEVIDNSLQTHVPNIYAIGDVIGKIQLAHVASAEGIHVAHNIFQNKKKQFDYKVVPNCIYTVPEVASVGITQREAEAQGHEISIGKAHFRILGKAMASGETEGFVKVIIDKKYGEILGVHMIGAHVTDMIHEGVTAMKLEGTLDYMTETIHAHPTMSEAVLEAFEDAAGYAIHK